MSTHMLQQGHGIRRGRKNYKDMNDKLFKFWDDHSTYKITTEQLLEKVAEMYTSFNAVRFTVRMPMMVVNLKTRPNNCVFVVLIVVLY